MSTIKPIPLAIASELMTLDPIFRSVYEAHGLAPDWQRPPGFASLLKIILEQQVSLESAQAAYDQLVAKVGEANPEAILKLSDEELRACYFSRQKSRYARILAQAVVDETLLLDQLHTFEEPAIRQQLCALTGIGNWTADVYLMFCLRHPDIFPPGDIAAINAVKELTGLKTKEEVVARSREWQPWRTYATKMLWHSYLCRRGRG